MVGVRAPARRPFGRHEGETKQGVLMRRNAIRFAPAFDHALQNDDRHVLSASSNPRASRRVGLNEHEWLRRAAEKT